MNKQLAVLMILVASLGFCARANGQSSGSNAAARASSAASQEMNRTSKVGTCVPMTPKKTPGRREPAPQPTGPGVLAVCAPVITIGVPPAPIPAAGEIADGAKDLPVSASPKKPALPPGATSAPVETSNSFKFKIKDVLEADLTSRNQYLIWALLAVFVVFAALIVFAIKAASKNPRTRYGVIALAVVLAALVAYAVVQRMAPQHVPDTTVARLSELFASTANHPLASGDANGPAVAPQVQRQIAVLQEDIKEQSQRMALRFDELSRLASRTSFAPNWLLGSLIASAFLAIGAVLGFCASRSRTPVASTMPLNAIYRLEDQLSQMRMNSNKLARLLEFDKKPELDPNEFLLALNSVRRQLEGGLGVGAAISRETPLASAQYRIAEDTRSFMFFDLNKDLDELDEVLSARYQLKLRDWRPAVLKALAKTRRSLVTLCEPVLDPMVDSHAP